MSMLPCLPVDTNEAIRRRIGELIDRGVTQEVIAEKIGVSETWLSRWVNQKGPSALVLNVDSMDRFVAYLRELHSATAALATSLDNHQEPPTGQTFRSVTADGTSTLLDSRRDRRLDRRIRAGRHSAILKLVSRMEDDR